MAALIAWRNFINDPGVSLSSPGVAIDPAYPLSNLQRRGLADRTQSSGGENLVLVAESLSGWGSRGVNVVGLLGVQTPTDTFSGTYYLEESWTGTSWTPIASISAFDESLPALPRNVFFLFPAAINPANFIRIRTNHLAQFSNLARLWIGPALVLPDGVDAGWQMGFRDSGTLDSTEGQQWVESAGVRTRVLTIPLDAARDTMTSWGFNDTDTMAPARPSLQALQLEAGCTGEVIAFPRISSPLWVSRSGVYGHIEQPWSITHKAGPYWGGSLTIVEER